jgi:hypothetical protein
MSEKYYVLAFDSNSPGVLTVVELNIRSSFVLTEGVKPLGVWACACAMLAKAATTIEVVIYMVMVLF